jgi:hypothetical protein
MFEIYYGNFDEIREEIEKSVAKKFNYATEGRHTFPPLHNRVTLSHFHSPLFL